MDIGIPCHHYFQALGVMTNLHFIIGAVRARSSDYCKQEYLTQSRSPQHSCNKYPIATSAASNPNHSNSHPVYRSENSIPQSTNGNPTTHSRNSNTRTTHGIRRSAQAGERFQEALHDLPALNPKGKPGSQRMTGATEFESVLKYSYDNKSFGFPCKQFNQKP